jgi:chromosome partitioning protein
MTRIIALVNQKGGVGKTTSTINIGAGLTRHKKKVLLVDLDPQANLTYSLGIDAHNLEDTIYEVLKSEIDAKDAIISKNGYDIIPASINLSGAEIELSGAAGRELLLKEAFSDVIKQYDYILLDCPPSLGLLTLNGLTTATEVYIPLQTEFLALHGMSKLLQTIDVIKRRLNNKLRITGIIGTLYDKRKKLNQEVISKIKEHFSDKLFNTLIRDNISLAEAPSYGQDIITYKKDSNGAIDYLALSKEIINQERQQWGHRLSSVKQRNN